ncbi:hypothetical protein KUV85_04885 [Nocardioides panacisoli]|uniref:galactokinase n=1 Tax=Nocardioides panacisoli TaxID=627624 RepID=UPI001C62AF16|nr:galactokinase family protein [Nocardioides panacisoli]QYJ05024.1 hypothetical protein KUV85_04885 [Nocardioides panacisoli]
MVIEASAPGRVNLIGEHTDYNGGRCLPFAIDLRTTVVLRPRPSPRVTVRSVQAGAAVTVEFGDLRPGVRRDWSAHPLGVLWALAEDGWPVPGMDVAIDGAVPPGAGLASSAALGCAVATAVAGLRGGLVDDATRDRLAAACHRAETEFVGAPTGGMDQAVAMRGSAGHALLLDFGDGSRRSVPLAPADAGLTLQVIDTGHAHDLATEEGYADRRRECAAAADALGRPQLRGATAADLADIADPVLRARARHVVTEEERVDAVLVALEDADWTAVGAALTASHRSLRDDFAASTSALDLAVDSALTAGALGARLVGGGFGGSAVALTPRDRAADVRDAVDAAFAAADLPPPGHHEVTPAAGASVTSAQRWTARGPGAPR